ncbi:MAG: hypothetical protein OEY44_00915 [Candidatus Peregrinibacteria bacterium]|nr:hypothetical protein [Candidatus Peregrinibacteria bacterium]
MDLSVFTAQVLAAVYLAIGLGMLLDKAHYKKLFDAALKDTGVMYLGGVMALVTGLALVNFHNEWVKSWEVLVTIMGWLALIKGVLLLALPGKFLGMTKSWVNSKNLGTYSVIVIALGLVFGYYGFLV